MLCCLDHVTVAVSQAEYSYWKQQCKTEPQLSCRKTESSLKAYEGCYLSCSPAFYLEIVPASPSQVPVAVALRCPGTLEDLQTHFPDWDFEIEKLSSQGQEWFEAYYSAEMETQFAFVSFIRYLREPKANSLGAGPGPFSESSIILDLSTAELESLSEILDHCGLTLHPTPEGIRVQDDVKQGFQMKATQATQRVNLAVL